MDDVSKAGMLTTVSVGRHSHHERQVAQLLLHGRWRGDEGVWAGLRKDRCGHTLCQSDHEGPHQGACQWHEEDLGLQGQGPWFPRHLHQGDEEERAAKAGFGFSWYHQGSLKESSGRSFWSQCDLVWENKDRDLYDGQRAIGTDCIHWGCRRRWQRHQREQDRDDRAYGSATEAGQRLANAKGILGLFPLAD